MTDTEVANTIFFYFSNKLNINAIPQDPLNDIYTINLNYNHNDRIFSIKLFLIHRLTTKENVKEIIEKNIRYFVNTVKHKLGFEKPNKIYKQAVNTIDATNYSEVILTYNLTEGIENSLLVLSRMK